MVWYKNVIHIPTYWFVLFCHGTKQNRNTVGLIASPRKHSTINKTKISFEYMYFNTVIKQTSWKIFPYFTLAM